MDVFPKQWDAKIETAQVSYKRNLASTVRRTQQFHLGQRIFADKPLVQMTESECMANAPLTKCLPKTVGKFKFILVTPDTVAVNVNGIHNTLFTDKVTLAPRNARSKDENYESNDMQNAYSRTNEDETNENGARVSEEFSVQGYSDMSRPTNNRNVLSNGREIYQKRTLHSHQAIFPNILLRVTEANRTDRKIGNNRSNIKGLLRTKTGLTRYSSLSMQKKRRGSRGKKKLTT